MHFVMAGESKFLPQSLSESLRWLVARVSGGVIFVIGVWAVCALLFYNPYLDGFAVASTFGEQSVMGNLVGIVRYAVGMVPALFLLMCVARWGFVKLIGLDDGGSPEYNVLRGFIAVCVGAAGLGLIASGASFGGMFGAIVAIDLGRVLGGVLSVIVGILFVGLFLVMAGVLLHVKWSHVRGALRVFMRCVRWVGAAFHLTRVDGCGMRSVQADDASSADAEEAAEGPKTEDAEPQKKRRSLLGRKSEKKPVAVASATAVTVAPKRVRAQSVYQLPDPKLLDKSDFAKYSVTPELKQNARAIEVHFAEYGVLGRVVGIKPGPVVTLYEFEPDAGQRIADILKTVKDMTRAMAVENFRIAQLPKSNYLGIEVANIKRLAVRYRGMMEDEMFVDSQYKIPLALGVNIGGHPMYFDLAKMPHMMVAGRTGSGKSVFVQSIITSIVYHFTPDKCKLIIIDPKGVDFGFWDNIPHLITPIVKLEPQPAINALKWAVREMEDRYKRIGMVNARNIFSYNDIMAEKRASGEKMTKQVQVGTDPETGEALFETQEIDMSDMPFIVIVIDEVADLMAVARKEVELCVQRIAQKARAAGIHLIMATQRPDATIITGVIKANFPTRVSFQAASRIDSMTSLGVGGAEQLLSMGDMLFTEGGRAPVRIHGAFISDTELQRIGDFLRSQGEPEFVEGVTSDAGEDGGDMVGLPSAIGGSGGGGDKDADLYARAKEFVIRDKKPTISYLQRRLQIGYNKAAGFMERMEEEGIVSAPDANNKRQIL